MEPEAGKEKKEKIRYDRALLDKVLERDGARLVEGDNYEKLNKNTTIKFICKCGEEGERGFRYCYENVGLNCDICLFGKERKKAIRFDRALLEAVLERDGARLVEGEKYDKLNRDTKIKFICKCGENGEREFRKCYDIEFACKKCATSVKINKQAKTNINKYGCINVFQNENIKEKSKNTMVENYGVDSPLKSDKIKDKIKKTCKEKYGVEHNSQSQMIKKKKKETTLSHYGVEHPNQNSEIFEKAMKNAKKFKPFTMPSGTVRKVQGYEPFALRDLLKTYTEDQIKTDRKEVGRIKYKTSEENAKERYYFPDIYLPHEKKFIEVKSPWTAKQNPELIEAKAAACREQGFACEIWVYNAKGERVES